MFYSLPTKYTLKVYFFIHNVLVLLQLCYIFSLVWCILLLLNTSLNSKRNLKLKGKKHFAESRVTGDILEEIKSVFCSDQKYHTNYSCPVQSNWIFPCWAFALLQPFLHSISVWGAAQGSISGSRKRKHMLQTTGFHWPSAVLHRALCNLLRWIQKLELGRKLLKFPIRIHTRCSL